MKRLAVAALAALCFSLQACASASPTVQQADPPTLTPPVPTEYVPTAIPATPTYEGCAYMWGSQDLPQLSRQLNAELQKISMDASALAYVYGEYCVYGDGHRTFSAMETDFRIGVKVKTLRDEYNLGDWIRRVMTLVLDIPPDQLEGPQSGRVDFDFKLPDPADIFVTVPIERYRNEADNLRGADLLHLFYP